MPSANSILNRRLALIKQRYGLTSDDGGKTLKDDYAGTPQVVYKITGVDMTKCELVEADVVFYNARRSRTAWARAARAVKLLYPRARINKHTRTLTEKDFIWMDQETARSNRQLESA